VTESKLFVSILKQTMLKIFISRPRPKSWAQIFRSRPRLWNSDSRQKQGLDNTKPECSRNPRLSTRP